MRNRRRAFKSFVIRAVLFQRRADLGEVRGELAADAVHGGDDGNRNPRRDESILNRSGSAFIPEKSGNFFHASHHATKALKPDESDPELVLAVSLKWISQFGDQNEKRRPTQAA